MHVDYTPKYWEDYHKGKLRISVHNDTVYIGEAIESVAINMERLTAEECYKIADIVRNIGHSKDPCYELELAVNGE